jgi:hypothetical protein
MRLPVLEVHCAAFVTAALGGKLSPSMTWIRDKRPLPTTRYRPAYSLSLFLGSICKEGVGPIDWCFSFFIQTSDAKLSSLWNVSTNVQQHLNVQRWLVKARSLQFYHQWLPLSGRSVILPDGFFKSKAVLRIRDILVRIRIRIRGSVPTSD